MGITPEILAALVAAAGSAAAADAWERLRSLIRNRLPDKYRAVLGESDVPSVQAGIVGTVPGAGERDLTLEERLAELTDLMGRSSILVEQVSAELDARVATAQKLQEEARQAEELASINREQAEAIRRLMNADLAATLKDNGTTIRRDIRKDAIRIGVGSFIAGGGLTLSSHSLFTRCTNADAAQVLGPHSSDVIVAAGGVHRPRIRVARLRSALGYLVLAVDALGVDPEQDGDAVPGPLGDLGGRDSAVEPGGDTGVPKVVDAPCEW